MQQRTSMRECCLIVFVGLLLVGRTAGAEESLVLPLWPGAVPRRLRDDWAGTRARSFGSSNENRKVDHQRQESNAYDFPTGQ